jgi:hypothetical protein
MPTHTIQNQPPLQCTAPIRHISNDFGDSIGYALHSTISRTPPFHLGQDRPTTGPIQPHPTPCHHPKPSVAMLTHCLESLGPPPHSPLPSTSGVRTSGAVQYYLFLRCHLVPSRYGWNGRSRSVPGTDLDHAPKLAPGSASMPLCFTR